MAEERWRIERRQNGDSITPSPLATTRITAAPTLASSLSDIVSAGPASSTPVTFVSDSSTRTQASIFSTSETSTLTHSSTTSNTAPTASKTGSSGSSSGSSVPIAAIVAPVVAVLVTIFIVFWFVLRRRTKKALEQEPEFVMEGMKEKPRDRPPTADSSSSTQELVPNKIKEAAINVKEVDHSIPTLPPINRDATFAPPRLELAMDSRPESRQSDLNGRSKAIPNFSRGPRPNTGSRDITSSPAPGLMQMQQQEQNGNTGGQFPLSAGAPAQRQEGGFYGQDRADPSSRPMGRPLHPRNGSFSRPLGPPPPGVNRGPPAPISTGSSRPSYEERPHHSPTGAYNGSSPISQYSPIVKDMPKFGTSPVAAKPNTQARAAGGSISSMNDQGNRKPPPSAIKTSNPPLPPTEPNFTNEQTRTAPLTNNTRLGFHSMVATTAATSPATEEPPTPSPRLPPPATRDAPPTNYNIPLPTHEPPAPASIQARLNGASISDRRSVVSGLSDDYVDVEVDDAKSDVSSLDEREKWQMHSDSERANSRQAGLGGYGGLGPRPPLLTSSESNSEGNDSQYSLGYYTKDHIANDKQ